MGAFLFGAFAMLVFSFCFRVYRDWTSHCQFCEEGACHKTAVIRGPNGSKITINLAVRCDRGRLDK